MGFATLSHFTLHLSGRRVEMREVKVLAVNRSLHLVGTVKGEDEAIASGNPNIVLKRKRREEREAIIRLTAHEGEILALDEKGFLGFVVWDEEGNHRKLPDFMRRLLGVSP